MYCEVGEERGRSSRVPVYECGTGISWPANSSTARDALLSTELQPSTSRSKLATDTHLPRSSISTTLNSNSISSIVSVNNPSSHLPHTKPVYKNVAPAAPHTPPSRVKMG